MDAVDLTQIWCVLNPCYINWSFPQPWKIFTLLFLCVWYFGLHVCLCTECTPGACRWLAASRWNFRINPLPPPHIYTPPLSSARAISALTLWGISSVPNKALKENCFSFLAASWVMIFVFNILQVSCRCHSEPSCVKACWWLFQDSSFNV